MNGPKEGHLRMTPVLEGGRGSKGGCINLSQIEAREGVKNTKNVTRYIDISSLQKWTHHQHSLPSHQRGGAPPSSGPHAAVARLPSAGLPGAARYMPPKRAASDLYSRFGILDRSSKKIIVFSPQHINLGHYLLMLKV